MQTVLAAFIAGGCTLVAAALMVEASQMAAVLLVVGIVLVLGGTVGGYLEWRKGRTPRYDVWDKRAEFRLWEAACLWAGQEPSKPLSWAARRRLDTLKAAVENETLKVAQPSKREFVYVVSDKRRHGKPMTISPDWLVTRDALRSYAGEIRAKPKFLFPAERIH